MLIKPYEEPSLLPILRSLTDRYQLSPEWKPQYQQLEKGHQGEVNFSSSLQELTTNCLILHGLLLESQNTLFQIDTLLIFEKEIYLIEVKYYEGDYALGSGNWYTLAKKEIHNPILQLNRSASLLLRLLQRMKFSSLFENTHFLTIPSLRCTMQIPNCLLSSQIKLIAL